MSCHNTGKHAIRRLTWAGATIGATLFLCGLAYAQSAPAKSVVGGVQISVRDVAAEGQLIRVPVNKSVIVDFNVPVREVRLAKPEFAEVTAISPKQILVTGKAFGTTQIIVWIEGDDQRVFDVAVDLELDRLLASIHAAVPRAQVNAHALLDAVVLTGRVPDATAAERIMEVAGVFSTHVINQMVVAGTQQVLLRCTVAEVNRSVTRQLGINGWMAGENFRDGFLINNIAGINPANIGVPGGAVATANMPFTVGDGGIPVTGAPTISLGFPRAQMQVFIQALRENGLLRVLAEPNLVALNGREASFLAGGELPIPIVTQDRIKIEWKEFGVRLNFTPAVLAEDKIRIQVAPEVSEPDLTNAVTLGGVSVPAFATRRVQTEVEIGAGETFAIGGLLNERVRAISNRVPGLGDLPVLGALFRSVEYTKEESELVVLITPELVDPVSPNQVTYVPGADHIAPNDFELYMAGEIEGQPGEQLPGLKPRPNQTWPVRPSELYGPSTANQLRGPLGPSGGGDGL